MKIDTIKCKDLILSIQKQFKLQSVSVTYDSKSVLKERLNKGAHIVFLNVMDNP